MPLSRNFLPKEPGQVQFFGEELYLSRFFS